MCENQQNVLDCNVSLRRMWQDFCAKHPNFKANCSKIRNKGPVATISTFRNIFQQNLLETLSFHHGWIAVNTVTEFKMLSVSTEINGQNLRWAEEIRRLKANLEFHLKESEVRFASLRYDMHILQRKGISCNELTKLPPLLNCDKLSSMLFGLSFHLVRLQQKTAKTHA